MASFMEVSAGGLVLGFSNDRPEVSGWYFFVGREVGCDGVWAFLRRVDGRWMVFGDWLNPPGPPPSVDGRWGFPDQPVSIEEFLAGGQFFAWAGPVSLRGGGGGRIGSRGESPVASQWEIGNGVAVGHTGAVRSGAGWWRVYMPRWSSFVWCRVGALVPGHYPGSGWIHHEGHSATMEAESNWAGWFRELVPETVVLYCEPWRNPEWLGWEARDDDGASEGRAVLGPVVSWERGHVGWGPIGFRRVS